MKEVVNRDFFIFETGPTRPADHCLGYYEGSVYMDFNDREGGKVSLIRISFDRYGCCNLESNSTPMDDADSNAFREQISAGISEQDTLRRIIKKTIATNTAFIWNDALRDYDLL